MDTAERFAGELGEVDEDGLQLVTIRDSLTGETWVHVIRFDHAVQWLGQEIECLVEAAAGGLEPIPAPIAPARIVGDPMTERSSTLAENLEFVARAYYYGLVTVDARELRLALLDLADAGSHELAEAGDAIAPDSLTPGSYTAFELADFARELFNYEGRCDSCGAEIDGLEGDE